MPRYVEKGAKVCNCNCDKYICKKECECNMKMTQADLRREYQENMEKEFGRKAKPGYHLVRNIQTNGVVELKDGTPACCDPSTETFHCM